ncbi:MAG: site-specific DNA-methyltransferase [Myxococcaceae bacterium]|nr:site-specific DNA-methyltransferase [Myxococcaceae bacterium]MCA3012573.1 site-specific DNA-methyltransferase [Myxococcaceae bacterium]
MSVATLANARARAGIDLSSHVHARGRDWLLYQGDSQRLLEGFEAATFDLIFADPPYFLSNGGTTCQSGRRVKVDKGAWDASRGVEHDHDFTARWLEQCHRVLKPSGTLWVSGTQHVIFNVGFAMQKLGFKILNMVTWFKPNASPNLACRTFTHSTELLIWAAPMSKGKLLHTFNYKRMKEENGGKQMRDVWTMPTPRPSEKVHGRHPTQKPRKLLERIVDACTEEDALVLDPFCGSGTTGVAAKARSRRFVGIDLDPQYLDLTKRRLEAEAPSGPGRQA